MFNPVLKENKTPFYANNLMQVLEIIDIFHESFGEHSLFALEI